MTYKFGAESESHLVGVHPDLIRIARIAEPIWDCKVLDGVRTLEEQRKNIERGVSRTMASKHLPQLDGLSHAIDIMPYPVDWAAIEKGLSAIKRMDAGMQIAEAYAFMGFMQGIAAALGIKLRSGGDWDSDREFSEHSFIDLPHHEIIT